MNEFKKMPESIKNHNGVSVSVVIGPEKYEAMAKCYNACYGDAGVVGELVVALKKISINDIGKCWVSNKNFAAIRIDNNLKRKRRIARETLQMAGVEL